jgi:hypothetical protein
MGKTADKKRKGMAGHAYHRAKKADKSERDKALREWLRGGADGKRPDNLPIGYPRRRR